MPRKASTHSGWIAAQQVPALLWICMAVLSGCQHLERTGHPELQGFSDAAVAALDAPRRPTPAVPELAEHTLHEPSGVPTQEVSFADAPEAEHLLLSDVILSVYDSYPLFEVALRKRDVAAGRELTAWGEFDTGLKAYSVTNPMGFYKRYRTSARSWSANEVRGIFGSGQHLRVSMATILDGTSNTFLFSEAKIGVQGSRRVGEAFARDVGHGGWGVFPPPSICLARIGANRELTGNIQTGNQQIGWRWADAHAVYTQWHVVLPPNSPSCGNAAEDWALISASSYHPGGVVVALADASVRFISETIDAGDPTLTERDFAIDPNRPQDYGGASLRGVWGALGSSRGRESVTLP